MVIIIFIFFGISQIWYVIENLILIKEQLSQTEQSAPANLIKEKFTGEKATRVEMSSTQIHINIQHFAYNTIVRGEAS